MKAIIGKLAVGPLRYAVRYVLQRPGLKKRMRDMVTRMPRLHGFVLRMMFEAPALRQSRLSGDQKNLSPHARRTHRALKQAIRTQRR
jgi:hypothetical protein